MKRRAGCGSTTADDDAVDGSAGDGAGVGAGVGVGVRVDINVDVAGQRSANPWRLGAASAAAVLLFATTTGCAGLSYVAQAAAGHVDVLRRARPVDDWLADAGTPAGLRERLRASQRLRNFAVAELKLPDNDSYRRYADLQREAALWNVVAAPALSLTLKTWCFPVMGCVGYRGYYGRDDAQALAAALTAQGWEVDVYGVPAYSTLGYSNWVGGDPLLNTFVGWGDADLARLIFHELAHQVAYAPDDTTFNESFAVAVERIGGERWLARYGTPQDRAQAAAADSRRRDFQALAQNYRQRLQDLYASGLPAAEMRAAKTAVMAALQVEHARIKAERWGGHAGYDRWVAKANNASFGVLAAYNEAVPNFIALYDREGRDLERFYAAVQALARLPKADRAAALAAVRP